MKRNGKIIALTKEPYSPVFFENAVDVSGCIVTPGLIDHHCHIYPLAEKIGIRLEFIPVTDEFLPDIIKDAVSIPSRRVGAFSKYEQCRIYG